MIVFEAISFLEEAAKYFEKRPTNGEDMAHWSNVYNAENCRKIANLIDELFVETQRLNELLGAQNDGKKD